MRAPMVMFAALAACVPTQALQFPELEGTGSVLVLSESDGVLTVLGFERGEPRVAFNLAHGDGPNKLLVLSFPHTLRSMGMEEGEIIIPPERQARSLPRPLSARYGESEDGPIENLAELSVEEASALELFKRAKIPEPTPGGCADEYGCYTDDADRLCLMPCEATPPEVQRPRPFENLPRLECPWTEELIPVSTVAVELAELKGCRPIREASCTSDQYWRPGFSACRPVTSPCPLGQDPVWSSTTAPNTYYVHAGAAENGDGSMARPYASIGEAVSKAPEGSTLLLSASTFAEHPSIGKNFTLLGACERTVVSGFSITGARTRVRDLVLTSMPDRSTIDVARRGALDLARVIFRATGTVPVHTVEVYGTATVADSLVDAPAGNAFANGGVGFTAVRGVEVRQHHGRGFSVLGGAVQVSDSVLSGAPGAHRGIYVTSARVDIARTLIEHSGATGVHAAEKAIVGVSQSLISNTHSLVSDIEGTVEGTGIYAQLDSVLNVDRTVIEDSDGYGILVQETAVAEVRDSIVRNAGPGPLFGFGECIYGFLPATISVERFVCINGGVNGINLTEGTLADLHDVAIVDLKSSDSAAIAVEGGATAILDRILIANVATRALVANGKNVLRNDVTVVINDLEVRGAGGGGMDLNSRVSVRGDRVWLEKIGGFGVFAKLLADVELRDLTIKGVSLVKNNPACEVACPGDGLLSTNDGAIEVQNFDISGAIYSGARLTFSGDIDLAFGRISDSGRALFVDREDFDVRRLLRQVVLEGDDPFESPPPP